LIPLKIKWYAFSTIDIAFDAEALELARQSGCQALFIGIETIRPLTLAKNAACGIKTSGDYIRALQRVRSHGIQVVGSLIVGLDQDRHQDYWRLLGFLIRTLFQCRFLCVAMGIFTPYPGSVLFERLRKEGRLLTTRWDLYDLPWRVLYKPKTMSWWAVTLWFVVLRFVAFVCSTIGLLLVSCMLMALYINHMILIKFGTWETCYREVSHVFMSWIWILRGLQG
jgi:radical SAM superfamily enzyme YgiQ (UPF0313 family)